MTADIVVSAAQLWSALMTTDGVVSADDRWYRHQRWWPLMTTDVIVSADNRWRRRHYYWLYDVPETFIYTEK